MLTYLHSWGVDHAAPRRWRQNHSEAQRIHVAVLKRSASQDCMVVVPEGRVLEGVLRGHGTAKQEDLAEDLVRKPGFWDGVDAWGILRIELVVEFAFS